MAPEPAHTTRGRPVTPFRTRSRSAKFIMRTTKRVVAHNRVTCMMTKTGRIELMSSRLPAPRTSSESPGVGTVETQYTTVAIPDDPLHLVADGRLNHVTVAYETYGKLNTPSDNAVYTCHALTGDAHAAGFHPGVVRPEWWNITIGPGHIIDTSHFFVMSSNLWGVVLAPRDQLRLGSGLCQRRLPRRASRHRIVDRPDTRPHHVLIGGCFCRKVRAIPSARISRARVRHQPGQLSSSWGHDGHLCTKETAL